jgi:hypothetical protein
VRLGVYDILGREVALLVDERKAVGRYEVRWDATGCPSGVYLCRMMIGGGDVPVSVRVRRMLLLR